MKHLKDSVTWKNEDTISFGDELFVQLHEGRVTAPTARPENNDVHLLSSCKAFQVLDRGCLARISLKDRSESEHVSIHSLLCPLGLFERYTLYENRERLCNLEECGHDFFWGRAVGAVIRGPCNCTNHPFR